MKLSNGVANRVPNKEEKRLTKTSSKESKLDDIAEEGPKELPRLSESGNDLLNGSRTSMSEDWRKIFDIIVQFQQDLKSDIQNLNNRLLLLDQRIFLTFDKLTNATDNTQKQSSLVTWYRQSTPPYATPLPNLPANTATVSAQSSQHLDNSGDKKEE